ncbi:hypothetical protein GGQ64_004652 [Rhizobium azooxidifex]|uniref:Uncharacterized protein n=1 Tax=Mycoplana azooxidifex TaxID=1636188 RepID=A0A7W6DF15_9HYPH|nr:hypothetical protein [Mycoplana azooxidifex]MBB3979410.1 hypothetical protein [Mycoplana azooxidifex]
MYTSKKVQDTFRRAWLRSVTDGVEVDDTEIRFHGRKTMLERLVMGGGAASAGLPGILRAGQDSDQCFPLKELTGSS